jgi:hypothetical protein
MFKSQQGGWCCQRRADEQAVIGGRVRELMDGQRFQGTDGVGQRMDFDFDTE